MDDLPVCALSGAQVRFGAGAFTLGPLSLDIFSGQILGLRGANGAGKSTLLRLLAGVLSPDSGSRSYRRDVPGCVSYVPQDPALYETLSGLDNLRFWGAVYGLPRKAVSARSRWLLERMDLMEKARDPVSAYSGGMKRKLHLATALMVTPKLLLLDEPTVGADSGASEAILSMIRHMKLQNCAVVLTTHRQGELESVSDRLLTLEHGKLLSEEERP